MTRGFHRHFDSGSIAYFPSPAIISTFQRYKARIPERDRSDHWQGPYILTSCYVFNPFAAPEVSERHLASRDSQTNVSRARWFFELSIQAPGGSGRSG